MSVTPNPNRRSWVPAVPSPFLTPRPELRRPLDLRWADGGSSIRRIGNGSSGGDAEVNVQVAVRCRPLNGEEQRHNIQSAINCDEHKCEVSVLQAAACKQVDKTFAFDKVFGPEASQQSIYDSAVSPLVSDALEGYNCTIFAFGQTGTGKTYTMEGNMRPKAHNLSIDAGVIPRAVQHIFDTLEERKADYSMKITFLELYNEELTDLLAVDEESRFLKEPKRPILLLDDGKGGAVIRGLEEVVVYSPNEIFRLLEHGSAKRRSNDTSLNKQSSRSHAVFSINIHVKEVTVGREELIKTGRLNLVDLAGSENIARSGAREARAREAGEVNKSLLTLGRVITALVEHSFHVPYRDSKLTRLLRDSLGGKAKTCIIATISPSFYCLDETLVTLDYAHRAKSIKNKPEVNQKLSKSVLLKDLSIEIEKMKQDVRAAREKNGVYIPHERHELEEAEKKAMKEKMAHLEFDLERTSKQADRFKELFHAEQERSLDLENNLNQYKVNLEQYKSAMSGLQDVNSEAAVSLKEKEFLISNLLTSENAIVEHAKDLRAILGNTSGDMRALSAKLEKQLRIEEQNRTAMSNFGAELDDSLRSLHEIVDTSFWAQSQLIQSMNERISSHFAHKSEEADGFDVAFKNLKQRWSFGIQTLKDCASNLQTKSSVDLEHVKMNISSHTMAVENIMVISISEAERLLNDVRKSILDQKEFLVSFSDFYLKGLQCGLDSTQTLSRTLLGLFDDLKIRASMAHELIEEKQREHFHQMAEFEKTFKENSVQEDREVLNKIAEILSHRSSRREDMVSKTIQHLSESYNKEQQELQLMMSEVCRAADYGRLETTNYVQTAEDHFLVGNSSAKELKEQAQKLFLQSLNKADHSAHVLSHAQASIDHINKDSTEEIARFVDGMKEDFEDSVSRITSCSSEIDSLLTEGTIEMMATIEKSHLLDQESRRNMEAISSSLLNHLELLQGNHGHRADSIRNLADNCLYKQFMFGSPMNALPRGLTVNLRNMESIDALRTPLPDLIAKFRSENASEALNKGKQTPDHRNQPPRSPLVEPNRQVHTP